MILFSEPGGTMSGGSASGLWLQSSKGFQRDPRSHESLDEEACSRPKVPAFRGGQHNILAAFIQRDPDFASTARNPSATFQMHAFRRPFRELVIGKRLEPIPVFSPTEKCTSNFTYPPSDKTLHEGGWWRPMIARVKCEYGLLVTL
jgi:hypothetical protein